MVAFDFVLRRGVVTTVCLMLMLMMQIEIEEAVWQPECKQIARESTVTKLSPCHPSESMLWPDRNPSSNNVIIVGCDCFKTWMWGNDGVWLPGPDAQTVITLLNISYSDSLCHKSSQLQNIFQINNHRSQSLEWWAGLLASNEKDEVKLLSWTYRKYINFYINKEDSIRKFAKKLQLCSHKSRGCSIHPPHSTLILPLAVSSVLDPKYDISTYSLTS